MELHFGMIRDKEEIQAGLAESQLSNRQLAICFNRGDKLLVKICTVTDIVHTDGGTFVTLSAQLDDGSLETTRLPLDDIESIYQINDFPADA